MFLYISMSSVQYDCITHVSFVQFCASLKQLFLSDADKAIKHNRYSNLLSVSIAFIDRDHIQYIKTYFKHNIFHEKGIVFGHHIFLILSACNLDSLPSIRLEKMSMQIIVAKHDFFQKNWALIHLHMLQRLRIVNKPCIPNQLKISLSYLLMSGHYSLQLCKLVFYLAVFVYYTFSTSYVPNLN